MIDRAIREQVDALLFSAIDFEKNAEAIDRAAKAESELWLWTVR